MIKESVELSVLLTIAMVLINIGVDYVKSGLLAEGVMLIVLGLLIIIIYYLVVLPQYLEKSFSRWTN